MAKILINNVAVPIGEKLDSVHFIAPDLEPALEYYPQYLTHSEVKLSPIRYVNEILTIVCKTGGQREKILEQYVEWSGNFTQWLKENNALFNRAQETR